MIQLLLIILIVPWLFGRFIKAFFKIYRLEFFLFALGFIVMVSEFALVCYPATLFNTPFHIVCYITIAIYSIECFSILIWLIVTKEISFTLFLSKERLKNYLKSPAFWFMIIICCFQIIRLVVAEPFEMRDSKTYNALISDTLQTDQLFRTNPETGAYLSSPLDMPVKYCLSPWYPFLSMLSKLCHLHPLIIANTILPGYLLFIHYLILFALGCLLFENELENAFLFVALCAFSYEMTLFCHTPTMITLIWPAWGKGALSITIVPIILIVYIFYIEKPSRLDDYKFFILLLLIVIAGCSMSTMGALVLPLELGALGLTWSFRSRSFRPILCSILASTPSALYLVTYYFLNYLQNVR